MTGAGSEAPEHRPATLHLPLTNADTARDAVRRATGRIWYSEEGVLGAARIGVGADGGDRGAAWIAALPRSRWR